MRRFQVSVMGTLVINLALVGCGSGGPAKSTQEGPIEMSGSQPVLSSSGEAVGGPGSVSGEDIQSESGASSSDPTGGNP